MLSYELFGISISHFDPSRTFVRSGFISSAALACLRFLICVYAFTTIIVGYTWQAYNLSYLELKDINVPEYLVIANDKMIGRSFSYFTWLCFWSQSFYFLITSIHTLCYARRRQTLLHGDWQCKSGSIGVPTFLQLCHSLWYSSVVTYPWLVSIVFWGTMFGSWPEGRYEQWLNLSVHGLNSLFAAFEILIPATSRPPVSHLAVLLVVLSMYLGLAYLTKATQDFYVYEWLNPAHGKLSIVWHILGYTGAICAIFASVSVVLIGKERLAHRMADREFMEGSAEKIRDSEEQIWDVRLRELRDTPRSRALYV